MSDKCRIVLILIQLLCLFWMLRHLQEEPQVESVDAKDLRMDLEIRYHISEENAAEFLRAFREQR